MHLPSLPQEHKTIARARDADVRRRGRRCSMVKAAAPTGLRCIEAPGVLVAPLLQLVVPERLKLLACGM